MGVPLFYTEGTVHGPEVDFGVGWRRGSDHGYRVTWEAAWGPTDYSDRGDVVAVKGDTKVTLAEDLPLFVVEFLLAESYYGVGLGTSDDDGWATACGKQEDVGWVVRRLDRWSGCRIVRYAGKRYDGGILKAAREYARHNGFKSAPGGWIYDRRGKPYVQGWATFAKRLVGAGRIRQLRAERADGGYSETWIVTVGTTP